MYANNVRHSSTLRIPINLIFTNIYLVNFRDTKLRTFYFKIIKSIIQIIYIFLNSIEHTKKKIFRKDEYGLR